MIILNVCCRKFSFAFKILLCAAAAVWLVGCHGKATDENHEKTSPSDLAPASDSDYEAYLGDYVDTSAMSFQEIGDILNGLGITVKSDVLEKAEYSWNRLDPDEMDFVDKVGFVISYVGVGAYDSGTKTFIPSSDKVFCFDLENGAADQSLDIFFQGVNSIGGGAFKITDVKLDSVGKEDKESGIYDRNIKFKLNGKACSYKAEIYYDWFDTGLIAYMNDMLQKQKAANRLYYMVENQTCEVFFCSEAWAENFADKTGCELVSGER